MKAEGKCVGGGGTRQIGHDGERERNRRGEEGKRKAEGT
jgi:hypothetical protein